MIGLSGDRANWGQLSNVTLRRSLYCQIFAWNFQTKSNYNLGQLNQLLSSRMVMIPSSSPPPPYTPLLHQNHFWTISHCFGRSLAPSPYCALLRSSDDSIWPVNTCKLYSLQTQVGQWLIKPRASNPLLIREFRRRTNDLFSNNQLRHCNLFSSETVPPRSVALLWVTRELKHTEATCSRKW